MAETLWRVSSAQRRSIHAPALTPEHRAAITGTAPTATVGIPLGTLNVQLPSTTITYPAYVTTTATSREEPHVAEDERFRWRV